MWKSWKRGIAIPTLAAAAIAAVSIGVALSGAARSASGAPPAGPSYSIVKLDDANGSFGDAVAFGINKFGEIVGYVHDPAIPGPLRATYWKVTTSGGKIQSTLSILKGIPGVVEPSDAYGINDTGEIVGLGFPPGAEEGRALYWLGPNAEPVVLPPLPKHNESLAEAINNDGVICGRSNIRGGVYQAVAWRINLIAGIPVVWGPVPLPVAGAGSRAYSLNDNDASKVATIAGECGAAAVLWGVESLDDGSLAVASPPIVLDPGAEANGVNDSAAACGYLFGSPVEAVVWTGASRRILNRAKYVTSAYSQDLNNNGVIVGTGHYHRNFDVGDRAVVWPSATSSMILLDKFLVSSPFTTLLHAEAVNDQGQIVGWGWMAGVGQYGAFVAVPK